MRTLVRELARKRPRVRPRRFSAGFGPGAKKGRRLLPLPFLAVLTVLLLAACGARDAGSSQAGGGVKEASENAASGDASRTGVRAGAVGVRIPAPGGSFTRISPSELRDMLLREDFVLVNTHVPFAGNIPGTDLSIPYDEIGRNLDRLPAERGARIALYCRSGSMSASAAKTLVGLGYEDVLDLKGGMIAWKAAGFRLEGT